MSSSSSAAGHLDIGGVFERAGDLFQKTFGTIWIVALILLIPSAILQGLLGGDGWLGNLLAKLVQIGAAAWLAGAVVRIVQDAETGETGDYTIGEFLGSVWPRIIAIVILEFLVSLFISVGLFLLIIPGIFIALVLAVALPALVVEDIGIVEAMSRSADLTRDNRMRILAVGILVVLIAVGLGVLVILTSLITPILGAIVGIVLGVLLYPYLAMLRTVLYFRLVELKDGVAVVEETLVVEEDAGPPPAV